MKKRFLMYGVAVLFLLSSVLTLSSCAKRQVETTDAAPGTVAAETRALTPEEAAAERARQAEDAAYRARQEAERKAMLSEMQARQDVQAQIRQFQMEKIHFDFDKSDLRQDAREILKGKADWLRKNPGYKLTITGHCDERGTREYNMALGQRRADAAFKYLNSLGVAADRMVTVSKGKEEPFDLRSTPEAWAMNRRAEFKLSK